MFFPMRLLAKKDMQANTDGKNIYNDFVQFDFDTFFLVAARLFSFDGLQEDYANIHLSVKA